MSRSPSSAAPLAVAAAAAAAVGVLLASQAAAAAAAASHTTPSPSPTNPLPMPAPTPVPGQPFRDQPGTCAPEHDPIALALSIFLCVGLVVSYLPQIIRIIHKKSSLGFSPWFLLLGATSSSSSFLNLVALQWGLVRCCGVVSAGSCAESMMGIVQVMIQWLLFNVVLVLFLVYYPKELRYDRPNGTYYVQPPNDSALGSTHSHLTQTTDGGPGDLDSLDSHIAANYSGITSPGESGLEGPSSGSAFERLVPTFWPMWKAPKRQQQALSAHEEDEEEEEEEDEDQEEMLSDVEEGGESDVGASGLQAGDGSGQNGERAALLGIPSEMRGWRKKRGAKRRTAEWSLALALAWVVVLHFLFILAITILLVSTVPDSAYPDPITYPPVFAPAIAFSPVQLVLTDWNQQSLLFTNMTASAASSSTSRAVVAAVVDLAARDSRKVISRWAAFLGITGTILAAGQYVPQILHTQRVKAVGSLSIPMMCLQVPGSVIFVYSLAIRPGAEWSTVAAYVATGVFQLVLLVQCVFFYFRQKRLGLDDFGRPLAPPAERVQPDATTS
ncbi:hypothetical protein CF336_g5710 [Tilletia laevis]|uniref:Uncharacterized protein n=2 Tax=Tilletia TaxID=13289 RepID=A0A177USY4_9BASI|nr:hypothetical protein CF336_g5710 [Tilletia laevis]KAE8196594.1 hypothetical protein CF335_g4820 [Tilletia laevis]KAE8256990.1 hypothetical protein A4X03_0g4854 [Tilletia caries]CAD6945763.1 unnamed protein product [Tilletia caries]